MFPPFPRISNVTCAVFLFFFLIFFNSYFYFTYFQIILKIAKKIVIKSSPLSVNTIVCAVESVVNTEKLRILRFDSSFDFVLPLFTAIFIDDPLLDLPHSSFSISPPLSAALLAPPNLLELYLSFDQKNSKFKMPIAHLISPRHNDLRVSTSYTSPGILSHNLHGGGALLSSGTIKFAKRVS